MTNIILASTSPRRKELLAITGLKFQAVASDYEEDMTKKMKPLALARYLSFGKANALTDQLRKHIIIGADTFVALGDSLLGKPKTPKEARDMLRRISGKTVSIITGYTIIDTENKKKISRAVETKVMFKKMSEKEIAAYVKTKEPLDKAGAFAIQGMGAIFIKKIEGDYLGAVGLPLYSLVKDLEIFGVNVL